MVDHHVIGLLTLQRREQGRVVQAGLGLISVPEVVPQLDRRARIITDEVVEREQAGRDLSTSPTRRTLRAATWCTRRARLRRR